MTLACPACGSARVRRAFRGSLPTFWRCRACASLFDTDIMSAVDAAEMYGGERYFVKDGDREEPSELIGYSSNYLSERPYIEAKFDQVLQHLERYVPVGRLLDVGAGPGFMLTVAARRGWDALGFDINAWAVEYGRRELEVDLRVGSLDDATLAGQQFDAITMMDLIEHVPSADELLDQAARLLRPGGTLALLTPHAGAGISRVLGKRWPEVIPGEHVALFSVKGLTAALSRAGFAAAGWHTIGKQAPVATLLADVTATIPALGPKLQAVVAQRPIKDRIVDFDPHTKFCLYARRLPDGIRPTEHRPARVPKRRTELAGVDQAILEELGQTADAPRLMQSMFDTFGPFVAGAQVLEVGAGIGTFTRMMLAAGATSVLAMEPEPICADVLERAFGDNDRVQVTRDSLPDAPSVIGKPGHFDLVVCHNVLEHIGDDLGALQTMAAGLRVGGTLSLLVPAHAGLYGALDDAYGHWRRYSRLDVEAVVAQAGFDVQSVTAQNALGIVGWWTKNRRPGARIGAHSFAAYEALMAVWQPIESRLGLEVGLSWVVTATRSGLG